MSEAFAKQHQNDKRKAGSPPDLNPKKDDGATITVKSYTEAGKQGIRDDVKAAYDKVKDNPTAENVAATLKDKFGSKEWSEDYAGLKKHVGHPEQVAAVDAAVAKAAGPDGKISPDKLEQISQDIQDQTSGPVNGRRAEMEKNAPATAANYGLGTLNTFISTGLSASLMNNATGTIGGAFGVLQKFFGGDIPDMVGILKNGAIPDALKPPQIDNAPAAPAANMAMNMGMEMKGPSPNGPGMG